MSTSMEQHDTFIIQLFDIVLHTLKIQSDSFLIVISIMFNFKAGIFEDWNVITPCWCGEIDGLAMGIETLEEGTTDAECACS